MKSAMVSRQGSMSRLQGPRSLRSAGDGSPRRRAAKSVKFDKTDEVIQYVAATPEISEDNWDQVSLESCESDLDGRPLPTLPAFVIPPDLMSPRSATRMDSREQVLMNTPRFQAKLGAPLGETDDDFDFGGSNPLSPSSPTRKVTEQDERDNSADPESLDAASKSPELEEYQHNALPSPLQAELSPIIDRPSVEVRMDAIMESGSGMSPRMDGGGSWHRRTGSQMSDFSDGGPETYLPIKKIAVADVKEEDDEPASWRSQNDSALARQDSLQDDQRHPPTQKLSEKPLPPPVELDRTYSKRKRQIMQMLDPHGAGITQSVGFNTILEEEEEGEHEEGNSDKNFDPRSSHTPYNDRNSTHKELNLDIGDDSYWKDGFKRGFGDDSAQESSVIDEDTNDNLLVGNVSANQSIGISHEPAAQYAARLAGNTHDSFFNSSFNQADNDRNLDQATTKETIEIDQPSPELDMPILQNDATESEELPLQSRYTKNHGLTRSNSSSSSSSEDEEETMLERMQNDSNVQMLGLINESFDFNSLSPPSRIERAAAAEETSEDASRITYSEAEELSATEKRYSLPEDVSSDAYEDHSIDDRRELGSMSPVHISSSSPRSKTSRDLSFDELDSDIDEQARLPSSHKNSEDSLSEQLPKKKVDDGSVGEGSDQPYHPSDTPIDEIKEAEDEPSPEERPKMYPGVLPWDPSMDTTLDNLAAMPTPIIPPRSPERHRRSLLLDRPLQTQDGAVDESVVTPAENQNRFSLVQDETLGWEPENDEDEIEREEDLEGESADSLREDSIESFSHGSANEILPVPSDLTHAATTTVSPEDRDEDRDDMPVESSIENSGRPEKSQQESLRVNDEQSDATNGPEASMYVGKDDLDPNVLQYIANNDEIVEETGNDPVVTGESPASPQFASKRTGSTASLRDKHSFVPIPVPYLSPINFSTSPFLPFAAENQKPVSSRSPAVIEKEAVQPSIPSTVEHNKNYNKTHSVTPSMATDNGDFSILKEMSFNTEELSQFQDQSFVEKQQQENDYPLVDSPIKPQPELDSDLSDLENQQESSGDFLEKEDKHVDASKDALGDTTAKTDFNEMEAMKLVRTENETANGSNAINMTLDDGEVSISEPSFGENMASMMSLFSDQFHPAPEYNNEGLDRSSSRHSYTLRQSGSYVIATSPRRQRKSRTEAYDVLSEDESEYIVPQQPIQRSRGLSSGMTSAIPSAISIDALASSATPSVISGTTSSAYSLAQGSSTGSVPHSWGASKGSSTIGRSALSVILEPEEEAAQPANDKRVEHPEPMNLSRARAAVDTHEAAGTAKSVLPPVTTSPPRAAKVTVETNPKRGSNYELFTSGSEIYEPNCEAEKSEAIEFLNEASQHSVTANSTPVLQSVGQSSSEKQKTATPLLTSIQDTRETVNSIADANFKHLSSPTNLTDQNPVGLLYVVFKGITIGNLPNDTLATLQIDNGVHCIASKSIPASKLPSFRQEYRIGIIENTSAFAVLRLSSRSGANVKSLRLGSDGSFARFEFGALCKASYGEQKEGVKLQGQDVWDKEEEKVVATAQVNALYVPCVSKSENPPQTLEGAKNRIARARQELSNRQPRASGILRQFGGDLRLKSGKQRYMVLDPIAPLLVAHSIRTKRPRTLINLAKATCVNRKSADCMEIQFKNRDTLTFRAANRDTLDNWMRKINDAMAHIDTARPKWIDAVLYDSH